MSRSNSEQYRIKEYGVSTREQTWEISYAHSLLRKEFCEQYGYKKDAHSWDTKDVSPYKACAYERSANLCRNHLLSVGLITPTNQPVMKRVLEIATQYAVTPTFELRTTTGDYTPRPLSCITAAYTELHSLKERQFLYVYLHQSLYDIRLVAVKEKRSGSFGSSDDTRTYLKLYPKAMVKELIEKLCHAKMTYFLDSRVQLRAKIFYDLDLKEINDENKDYGSIIKYEKDTPITVEEFERRMRMAQEAVSFYQRAYKELLAKRDRLAAGRTVDVSVDTYRKVVAYFKINAPLYMNEEHDTALAQFAKLVMMDADLKTIASQWDVA
jgi:hypothetical protein